MAPRKQQDDQPDTEQTDPESAAAVLTPETPGKANNARPNDLPIGGKADDNSTFATRAKRVSEAANKAVKSSDSK
jgi:hypothetical protein